MNKRFISVLVFALVVAGAASITVYRLLVGRINTDAAAATTKILVASRNLDAGTILRERDVDAAPWSGAVPEGAFLKPADLVGRAVATSIYGNEPVTEKRLGPKGSGGGLAATIPTGMRAVAIRVNDVAGVAGFVVPGTRVDVIVSSGGSGSGGMGSGGFSLGGSLGISLPSISIPSMNSGAETEAGTRTLLQNILVLSAGQDFKQDAEGKPVSVQVVNLLVTPLQAEMLSLASNQMTMQLVLRNPVDNELARSKGVTMSNIFTIQDQAPPPADGGPRPAPPASGRVLKASKAKPALPPPAAAPVIPTMEIIEGSRRTEVSLQLAGVR